MLFEPADIVLCRTDSLIGKLIRWRERSWGEGLSQINHVGIIGHGGSFGNSTVIESLLPHGVQEAPMSDAYPSDPDLKWAVARPINLNDSERSGIVEFARSRLGDDYGEGKLILHLLGLKWLAFRDRHPICSWLVAKAYESVGLDFDVPSRMADPDDIWDFVMANLGDKYDWAWPPQWGGGEELRGPSRT